MLYRLCTICKKRVEYGKQCQCEIDRGKARHKEYNARVRFIEENKKYADFYNSVAWKRMTEYIRTKYSNLCLMCLLKDNRIIQAELIHHILEIRTPEGWEDRLNEDGLVTLCHSCHNELHADYTEDKIKMLRELIKEYKEIYELGE